MPETRYVSQADGVKVVVLTGELEAWVRRAALEASAGTLEILEAEGAALALEAERQWYQDVHERTGRSGRIDTSTTISPTEVRVTIGSTDTRRAGGKPLPVYIHRPGPFSQKSRRATAAEAAQQLAAGMSPKRAWWVRYDNPKAGDGKYLVPELLVRPTRKRLKIISARLGQAIANKVRRG
jgi:hypothetical protein